jgi:hypothetical protein
MHLKERDASASHGPKYLLQRTRELQQATPVSIGKTDRIEFFLLDVARKKSRTPSAIGGSVRDGG